MNALSNLVSTLLFNEVNAPQEQLGVLRIQGSDARKLLQGQTSCDMTILSTESSLYGAICSVKGRIITNFFAIQKQEDILLVMNKELVETTLNHLKKYAVFFKTELSNASDDFTIRAEFKPTQTSVIPEHLSESLHTEHSENHTAVVISEFPAIASLVLEKSAEANRQTSQPAPQAAMLSLLTVRPLITAEQSETILPQWLNMQRTGGISFTKGCYTGQEIVARMQYRGKSKKQLALFLWEGEADATQAILDGEGKSIGSIFQTARFETLNIAQVILNVEPAETETFSLGDQPITWLPLPYLLDSTK